MAREGLRTLVVAKKSLSEENYADFEQRYSAAKLSVVNRSAQVEGKLCLFLCTRTNVYYGNSANL